MCTAGLRERLLTILTFNSRFKRDVEPASQFGAKEHTVPSPANDKEYYRVPQDLNVTTRPIKRWLIVGSCLAAGISDYVENLTDGAEGDYVLFNNGTVLPSSPPRPLDTYDCQLIQIAVRSIIPDFAHARLDFDDVSGFETLFEQCASRMEFLLDQASAYGRDGGFPTFVLNLAAPQQGLMGRIIARRDLRNFAYFIERLNDRLEDYVDAHKGFYIVDFGGILRTFGAKFFLDDVLLQYNHAAALGDNDHAGDQARMHVPAPATEHYTTQTGDFIHAMWEEVRGQFITLQRAGAVKLAIFDIDDTLWRGVVAELDAPDPVSLEGWPLGVAEAALYLKQRGIVIALVSKNSEERVRAVWNDMWMGRLRIEDFASVKINWKSKAENVAEVIAEVNVLPDSVVFIDDNPVERNLVEMSFPGIRTLGADLYYVRRILLWSPEMQPAVMTGEASRRNAMVKAQIDRESTRKIMNRDEFLASLGVRYMGVHVTNTEHPKFSRVFELLNKTNQFNTTGRRWSHAEIAKAFADGLEIFAFEAADKFTEYGLVGMALLRRSVVEQFVMSCRVIGLDLEFECIDELKVRNHTLRGVYVQTEKNMLSADLFEKADFTRVDDVWEWTNNSH